MKFYGEKKHAKGDQTFGHIAIAPREDPKETLAVLFQSGVTDMLRKTGMNEKTLLQKLGVQIGHISRKLLEHAKSTVPRISGTSYIRSEMLMSAHALSSAVCLFVGIQKNKPNKSTDLTIVQKSTFVVV